MTQTTLTDEEWHRSLVETHSLFYDASIDANTGEYQEI